MQERILPTSEYTQVPINFSMQAVPNASFRILQGIIENILSVSDGCSDIKGGNYE